MNLRWGVHRSASQKKKPTSHRVMDCCSAVEARTLTVQVPSPRGAQRAGVNGASSAARLMLTGFPRGDTTWSTYCSRWRALHFTCVSKLVPHTRSGERVDGRVCHLSQRISASEHVESALHFKREAIFVSLLALCSVISIRLVQLGTFRIICACARRHHLIRVCRCRQPKFLSTQTLLRIWTNVRNLCLWCWAVNMILVNFGNCLLLVRCTVVACNDRVKNSTMLVIELFSSRSGQIVVAP